MSVVDNINAMLSRYATHHGLNRIDDATGDSNIHHTASRRDEGHSLHEIRITIKYNDQTMQVLIHPDSTIDTLINAILSQPGFEDLSISKLLCRGKSLTPKSKTLRYFNIQQGDKIRIMGSVQRVRDRLRKLLSNSHINGTRFIDDTNSNISSLISNRISRGSRIFHPAITHGQYGFGAVRTLPGFSSESYAKEILEEIATHPGVLSVMRSHKWRVNVLSEMYPEGRVGVSPVCVLGYNQNKGAEISLRLRTDDMMGFRPFDRILNVLWHELAHMEYSDHDADFYQLNRQLEEEGRLLDWRNTPGHILGGRERYAPTDAAGQRYHVNHTARLVSQGPVQFHERHVLNRHSDTIHSQINPTTAAGNAALLRHQVYVHDNSTVSDPSNNLSNPTNHDQNIDLGHTSIMHEMETHTSQNVHDFDNTSPSYPRTISQTDLYNTTSSTTITSSRDKELLNSHPESNAFIAMNDIDSASHTNECNTTVQNHDVEQQRPIDNDQPFNTYNIPSHDTIQSNPSSSSSTEAHLHETTQSHNPDTVTETYDSSIGRVSPPMYESSLMEHYADQIHVLKPFIQEFKIDCTTFGVQQIEGIRILQLLIKNAMVAKDSTSKHRQFRSSNPKLKRLTANFSSSAQSILQFAGFEMPSKYPQNTQNDWWVWRADADLVRAWLTNEVLSMEAAALHKIVECTPIFHLGTFHIIARSSSITALINFIFTCLKAWMLCAISRCVFVERSINLGFPPEVG